MTSFETGLCLLHRVRVMSEDSDPCLVSHVSKPITDKSSLSSAPPALSLSLHFSELGVWARDTGDNKAGAGPSLVPTNEKNTRPELAHPGCQIFCRLRIFQLRLRNRNISTGTRRGGAGAEIYDRSCLCCGGVAPSLLSRNLRYLMANSQPWLAVWASPRLAGPGRPGRV